MSLGRSISRWFGFEDIDNDREMIRIYSKMEDEGNTTYLYTRYFN